MGVALPRDYGNSISALERAERVIPLGSQTFSKSRIQYPVGAAPLFMARAQGCRTWDVDGNSYIDLVSALGAITLGYADPEVNEAIHRQLSIGTVFSQPHALEVEVAELVSELVPGAERVRFGKSGSDATAAAVRLARAVTGRDRVMVGGYHGWHDWFIGTTSMNAGVPESVRNLTHRVEPSNPDGVTELFERYPDEFAAVVLEPCGAGGCDSETLLTITNAARERGTLVIFDEVVSGFRVSTGGAQLLSGIQADLVCLGKGMANGLPLSAITGRSDLMNNFERVFFSGTFGGECLSLAAARVTLTRVRDQGVVEKLYSVGQQIMDEVNGHLSSLNLPARVVGHPSWSFLVWDVREPQTLAELKTLMIQELALRGVLAIGSHLPNAAFRQRDIAEVVSAYCSALTVIDQALKLGETTKQLNGPVLQPLFTPRS